MNIPAYLWVYILFADVIITFLLTIGVYKGLRSVGVAEERSRRVSAVTAILLFSWMTTVMILAELGIFLAGGEHKFPFIAFGVGVPIFVGIWGIRRSGTFREILNAVPQSWLVGVQAYRGLGSIFLVLYGINLLPGTFALPAGFGDVLVGLIALPVASIYAARIPGRTALVAAWNFLGIADLAIALTVGFLTAPGPFHMFQSDLPNLLVGAYPLVMIPVYAVPISILLHIASLSKVRWSFKQVAVAHA